MEQKEKNDLICVFLPGRGGRELREGREAHASKKKCCELNCLQHKEGVYLLTIGQNNGN